MLCQLSYVGPHYTAAICSHILCPHPWSSMLELERAMGFEPTTASLEGWNSTTELRPPPANPPTLSLHKSFAKDSARRHISQRPVPQSSAQPARDRIDMDSVWWAGKGSNLGSHKAADLQSAPFVHLGTCPLDTHSQT